MSCKPLFFLFIWNWNDKYVYTLQQLVSSKTIPDSRPKMSRVYTRFRTERGNIPIWPVYRECHPRPRGLYRIIFSLVSCAFCEKGATRSHPAPTSNGTFWNTLGGRLEIDRNKVYFYARRTSSLSGKKDNRSCRSRHSRLDTCSQNSPQVSQHATTTLFDLESWLIFSLSPTFAFFFWRF